MVSDISYSEKGCDIINEVELLMQNVSFFFFPKSGVKYNASGLYRSIGNKNCVSRDG